MIYVYGHHFTKPTLKKVQHNFLRYITFKKGINISNIDYTNLKLESNLSDTVLLSTNYN